jgi:DNA-binding Lrp family transcriptional regulator
LEKLKSIDYKIIAALMKNSKTSDRQLAKQIGVSQPTVTRRRAKMENGALDGYTAVPQWAALGFEILAVTMVKNHPSVSLKENVKANFERAVKWMKTQPNVILCSGVRGMNRSGLMISVHKSYFDFDRFIAEHKRALGDLFSEIDTALVNLKGGEVIKPLHLKYLAEAI